MPGDRHVYAIADSVYLYRYPNRASGYLYRLSRLPSGEVELTDGRSKAMHPPITPTELCEMHKKLKEITGA